MKQILVNVREYNKFVSMAHPRMRAKFGDDEVTPSEIVSFLKEEFGLDISIVTTDPVWHLYFTPQSYTHFILTYS